VHLDRQSRQERIESITLLNNSRIQNKQDAVELSKPIATKQDVTAAYPTLNLIVKADVHGSLEAILGSLNGLPQHEVKIKVVSSKVGPVTDAEVDLAHTTKSTIISFNMRTEKKIKMNCDTQNCKLVEENIIYNLLDSVKELMADLLPLEETTHIRGEAEVLQIFEINVKGKEPDMIAGCRVLSGKVQKDKIMRISRRGDIIWSGKMKTFKHVKKDITEATKGLECGISMEGYKDIAVGDTIQCIEISKSKRKLT
jgi:translation initiation factor IF-2